MSSPLHCIGLGVGDPSELDALLDRVLERTHVVGRPGAVETRLWTDESGARVTLVLDSDDQLLELVPSFAGRGTATLAELTASGRYAAADVQEDGATLTRLLCELPQSPYLPRIPVDVTPALMTALGLDVTVHDSPEAFTSSPASLLGGAPPDEEVDGQPIRYGAESFVSYGLFGDPETAQPTAFLSGIVEAAETRTNSLTGERFHAALIRTAGFTATACLALDDHPEPPPAGGVVAGTWWMVADVPNLWKVQPKPGRSWLRRRRTAG